MIAAVDKLRGYCDRLARVDDNCVSAEYVAERCAIDVRGMADAIEREVAERFVELPVDADGVPIRFGDVLDGGWVVHGLTATCAVCHERHPGNTLDERYVRFIDAHHAKPRTVEDVLRDFQQDTLTSQGEYSGEVIDADEWKRQLERDVRDYADELRELMGVK